MKPQLINTVIIDDELSAISTLSRMIRKYCPQIEIVGIATTGEEAKHKIVGLKPDLLMLDIEMPPDINGIELVQELPYQNFDVIITTAYPQYAISCVNTIQPCGYMVKPYAVPQLLEIIENAIERFEQKKHVIRDRSELGITITDHKKGKVFIKYYEIDYCCADDTCVKIVYEVNGKKRSINTYRSLKYFEDALPEYFVRVHHNSIVNLDRVTHYKHKGRSGIVFLRDGVELAISVSRFGDFQEKMHSFFAKSR